MEGNSMALIFNYAVKYKGKYYPPNTPIVETIVENVDNPGKETAAVENHVENVDNHSEATAAKPKAKNGKVKKDGN